MHPDKIAEALDIMAQTIVVPHGTSHGKWGDGARTESKAICLSDSVFGPSFWRKMADSLADFHFDCLMDGHAEEPFVFIEREGSIAKFVCVSGPHKPHD